jgi:hypothetical protein
MLRLVQVSLISKKSLKPVSQAERNSHISSRMTATEKIPSNALNHHTNIAELSVLNKMPVLNYYKQTFTYPEVAE